MYHACLYIVYHTQYVRVRPVYIRMYVLSVLLVCIIYMASAYVNITFDSSDKSVNMRL